MGKRNHITCSCETCINSLLLQSDSNKWRLTILEKLDKLYINASSTRLLPRFNIYYIKIKNQIIPNNYTYI